ncbi:protein of unknown function [Paraburkholderia kururiensis]
MDMGVARSAWTTRGSDIKGIRSLVGFLTYRYTDLIRSLARRRALMRRSIIGMTIAGMRFSRIAVASARKR